MLVRFSMLNLIRSSILFLSLSLSACSDDLLPPGDRGGEIMLENEHKNMLLINRLEGEDIPYELSSQGWIKYMLADQAKVMGIIRSINYAEGLRDDVFESEIINDNEMKSEYISEFVRSGIQYHLGSHLGNEYIFWKQTDGPKVDVIRQRINVSLREKSREKAIINGEIPKEFIHFFRDNQK